MIEYIIDEDYSGIRLDSYIKKKLTSLSLTEIYKFIRKGNIKINNKKCKHDTRLNLGDRLQIYLKMDIGKEDDKKAFIKLSEDKTKKLKKIIVFEDENIFIINKEAGQVIHRGSGHSISLLEEYRAYFQNNIINFVNRIDKDTSGLVIGAKNIRTARKLAEYIREKKIKKKYYILVHGFIEDENFSLVNYLKKEEENVVVLDYEEKGYKKSTTYFKRIFSSKLYSLLEAELETGRTHQLRVQLAHIHHPIVGDKKYGRYDSEEEMFLHSYYIDIPNENIRISLEIPKTFIDKLKN
ncbi:MAG: RluA family pseudouridine synthase [Fusobacterium sp.]|uniref:RluA family pseudouridine synthase n=1 Tax=Fusobacterium sp. TaxID=68766 RepID=UPI0026DD874D|nr:RluA family pseudouridine synthase [Fusobacterium sp.]MDO4690695.1 RluA family pseudouridine synthase [Fusobacterium sp.]